MQVDIDFPSAGGDDAREGRTGWVMQVGDGDEAGGSEEARGDGMGRAEFGGREQA